MADRELETTFAHATDCIVRNPRQMNEPIISHQQQELHQPPPRPQEIPVLPPLQAFDMPLRHDHRYHPIQQQDQEVPQLIVPLQPHQREPHEPTAVPPPFDPNHQEDFEDQDHHFTNAEQQQPYDVLAHVNLISEIVDHQMNQLAAISSHLQELRHHLAENNAITRSTAKKRKVQTEKGYKDSLSYKKYIAAVIATNRRIVTEKVRSEAAFEDLVVTQCEKYKAHLKDELEKIDFVRRFVSWAQNKAKTVDWPEE